MKTLPTITSTDNKYFQMFKSLNDSRGLKKEKTFLVSGAKLVTEFIHKDPLAIKAIISTESLKHFFDKDHSVYPLTAALSLILNLKNLQHFQFSKSLFNEIDGLGTHAPLLWVDQKGIPTWDPNLHFTGLEVLCPLSDPQNLGAVIRSAWAFGASKIILFQESANPFLPKCWKSSAGAVWDMPIEKGPSLKDLKTHCIALDMDGENIWDFSWNKNVRLLLGEEGQGIPIHLKTSIQKIKLPMVHPIDSLNVAVTASIAMALYNNYS